jgi:hypothetical protein
MPVEWVDRPDYSRRQITPGFRLVVQQDGDPPYWETDFFNLPHYDTREAAKSAAEAEARRVLMRGLLELGWPDDAAVGQAREIIKGNAAHPASSNVVRAALTAAMGGE